MAAAAGPRGGVAMNPAAASAPGPAAPGLAHPLTLTAALDSAVATTLTLTATNGRTVLRSSKLALEQARQLLEDQPEDELLG